MMIRGDVVVLARPAMIINYLFCWRRSSLPLSLFINIVFFLLSTNVLVSAHGSNMIRAQHPSSISRSSGSSIPFPPPSSVTRIEPLDRGRGGKDGKEERWGRRRSGDDNLIISTAESDGPLCTVKDDCNSHASSVTTVPVSSSSSSGYEGPVGTTEYTCHCDCLYKWQGDQCGTCPLQYDPSVDCRACAAGYGPGYPDCSANAASSTASGTPCTISANCNGDEGHAIGVTGSIEKGCVCQCAHQWHGLQCGTCDLRYDPSNCDRCASGYLGTYPDCALPTPEPSLSPSPSSSGSRHDGRGNGNNKNNNDNNMETIGAIAIGASVVALLLLMWIIWAHYKSKNDTARRFDEERRVLLEDNQKTKDAFGSQRMVAGSAGPTIVGGKYALITELGRGSFGVVYLVRSVLSMSRTTSAASPLQISSPSFYSPTNATATTGVGAKGVQRKRSTSPPNADDNNNGGNLQNDSHHAAAPAATTSTSSSPTAAVVVSGDNREKEDSVAVRKPVQEEEEEEVFAMKVVKCRDDADLMKGVAEFRAMRTLQGHEGVVILLDMFIVWDASGPNSLLTSKTNVSAFLKSPNCRSRNVMGGTTTDDGLGSYHPYDEMDPPESARRELCIVMKYYGEGTLQSAIAANPMHYGSAEMLESFLRQVLSTLEHTHEHNIIHRDIKPANVLMDKGGTQFILSDFGLARPLDDTESTRAAGTLFFLSPEQLSYRVSKKSDVWAVACVCIIMSACRRKALQKGKAEDDLHDKRAIWMRRGDKDFESKLKKGELADLPKWLTHLILKMLAEELADRYSVAKCLEKLNEQQRIKVNKK